MLNENGKATLVVVQQTGGNRLLKVEDDAAYNADMAATSTVIKAVPSGGLFRSVTFAPGTLFKAPQRITFQALPAKTFGDEDFEAGAFSSVANLELSYSSSDTSVAQVIDGRIYLTGAGTATITATQEGDASHFPAAAVSQVLTVGQANQSIAFPAVAPQHTGDTVALAATSSAGLPVSYAVVSGPGSISDGTLSFTGEGNVTVSATQAGTRNYAAAAVTQQILVYAADGKRDGILLVVYPNPTKDRIKVKLENKKDREYSFRVYDSQGREVDFKVIPRGVQMFEVDFSLNGSPTGRYYIWVSDGTVTLVRQIIKQ